jgi:hypothetical protein|tara:strand:+ start:435 stop:905 length:471 start_codon:yes stop_codon:yes gene_type:complete
MALTKYIPQQPNIYQGKQVIINSDRLLFNAKDDAILLFADKAIGFNTKGTINFDTGPNEDTNSFIVNAPNIHLGLKGGKDSPTEPALLGDKTEEWLGRLISFLDVKLLNFLKAGYKSNCVYSAPGGQSPQFVTLKQELEMLQKDIKNIKSKNVKLV